MLSEIKKNSKHVPKPKDKQADVLGKVSDCETPKVFWCQAKGYYK